MMFKKRENAYTESKIHVDCPSIVDDRRSTFGYCTLTNGQIDNHEAVQKVNFKSLHTENVNFLG